MLFQILGQWDRTHMLNHLVGHTHNMLMNVGHTYDMLMNMLATHDMLMLNHLVGHTHNMLMNVGHTYDMLMNMLATHLKGFWKAFGRLLEMMDDSSRAWLNDDGWWYLDWNSFGTTMSANEPQYLYLTWRTAWWWTFIWMMIFLLRNKIGHFMSTLWTSIFNFGHSWLWWMIMLLDLHFSFILDLAPRCRPINGQICTWHRGHHACWMMIFGLECCWTFILTSFWFLLRNKIGHFMSTPPTSIFNFGHSWLMDDD